MIELQVYPARTFFSGSKSEIKVMLRALRIKDKNAFFKIKWLVRKFAYLQGERLERIKEQSKYIKFYDLRSGSFATGLLPRVRKYCKREQIEINIQKQGKRLRALEEVNRLPLQGIEQRPEQLSALNRILCFHRGVVHCAPNFGKTDLAISTVSELNRQLARETRTLYLVHRIGLAYQTIERFKKHDIEAHLLGAGTKDVPRYGVLVAMVQTAAKVLYKDEFQKFLGKCDCVFVDELHVNKAWQCEHIMDRCEAPMRIGMSGTISKKSKEKYMHYVGMCGPIIAETRNEELVNLGRSAKPIIRMLKISGPMVEGKYGDAYTNGIVLYDVRNQRIVSECLRYMAKDYRTLILVSRKKHGWILLKMLREKTDVPVQYILGSTSLEERKRRIKQFELGKAPVLIASPILDVGMDIPSIDAGIFAGGGVGWELILQRLGRLLRKKKGDNRVRVTDFYDFQNKYLKRHSKKRLKYYRDENIAEIKLIK